MALAGAAFALLAPADAKAEDDPAFLVLGAGAFDVFDNQTAGHFRFELRADRLVFIKPLIGVEATTDGAYYGYGGFNIDFHFGRRWVFSPGFAVGAFEEGDGKDLGATVEFRSGAEIAYRFNDRSRLGLSLHHISNAGITERNPGTEILELNYSIPIGHVFQ